MYPVGIASVILLAGAAAIEHDFSTFGRALLGAVGAFTFFFILHLVAPGGMGFGDVRLSAVLGLFLGWMGGMQVFGGLFLGFFLGAVIGMVLIAVGSRGRKQHIPFGPFLAAGTMIFVLFGDPITHWWRGLGH